MREPIISVVLPVYNGETFIAAAVDSILQQSEPNFELLVVDDGSSDNSARVAERAALSDNRVQVVRREHAGIVRSLNAGLLQSRGTFVARMDADDISHRERFARQLAHMRSHPECVAVGSGVQSIGHSPEYTRVLPARQTYIPGCRQEVAIMHPAAFIRAEALRKVGGYRIAFESAEDSDLWRRLIRVGEIHNLPEALIQYRHHPNQTSSLKRAIQILRDAVAVTLAADERLHDVELPSRPLTLSDVVKLARAHPSRFIRKNLHVDIAKYLLADRSYLRASAQIATTAILGPDALAQRAMEVARTARNSFRG